MSTVSNEINIPSIRKKLENLIETRAEVSADEARDFSFHMTDWLQDMEDLRQAFTTIDEVDEELLFSVVLKFLLHAPAHVVAAATTMTGETAKEILS